jgi:hypothetical protein
VNETDKERVISRVLNAEVTIFSYDPDSCAMVGDLKMGRYDAIFTDRRCLFFPVKSGDFWKHADWAMIGRLGGVVGVAIAHSAAALTDGVKSTLKDNEPYLLSELDALAQIGEAEAFRYDALISVEGHLEKRGLMQMAYFDAADINIHLTVKTNDYPRTYVITVSGGEKAARQIISAAGITLPILIKSK